MGMPAAGAPDATTTSQYLFALRPQSVHTHTEREKESTHTFRMRSSTRNHKQFSNTRYRKHIYRTNTHSHSFVVCSRKESVQKINDTRRQKNA